MPQIHVRPAAPADADTIAANNRAIASETEKLELAVDTVASGVRRVLNDAALGRYFIAEMDGCVVGQLMITTEFSDWRNGLFWWIQSVYVNPDHRRQGVYQALHDYVRKAARQTAGVCGLRLYVDRDNERAQHAYRRMHMRPTNYVLYEETWTSAAPPEQPVRARGR